MRLNFATLRLLRFRIDAAAKILVGRACRFSLGRRLFGVADSGALCLAPLDSHTRFSWERYLGIPPGRLQVPVPGAYTMLALHGQKVVGHVSVFRQWEKTDVAVPGWWLTGLEVTPRWRGVGVGRKLMNSVITMWEREHHEEPLYLVVNRRNVSASGLFFQYGFKELEDPEWERRLRRAYRQDRRGEWAYQVMKRDPMDQ